MMVPLEGFGARPTVSDRVGCGWMVRAMSNGPSYRSRKRPGRDNPAAKEDIR